MADEIEESGTEIDEPVAGIVDAITDEADPSLGGLDGDESQVEAAQEVTDESTETPGEEVDTDEPAATAKKPALSLPAAHIRSLKANDWSDEEIQQNIELLGDKFLPIAARIHKNRVAETAFYAEQGRRARAEQNAPKGQKPSADLADQLQAIDGDGLKKKYGEHDLIDSLVKPYNQLLAEFKRIAPIVQESQKRSQQAELETLSRQIDGFFGGKELDPYKEVYGTAQDQLTENQLATRNKVLETADALMVGAKVQGRTMSLGDALQLAHDSVSGGFKNQAARSQIKAGLKARSKGISLKPSGKSSLAKTSGIVKNRDDLERKVGNSLAKVFSES